jgi:hypothetical protein
MYITLQGRLLQSRIRKPDEETYIADTLLDFGPTLGPLA